MTELSSRKCIPCEGIGRVMTSQEINDSLKSTPSWEISEDQKSITRNYLYRNFVQCVEQINKIKDIAEQEGHHPDLHLTAFKNLKVVSFTHALGGLTMNDFILAAKINKLE